MSDHKSSLDGRTSYDIMNYTAAHKRGVEVKLISSLYPALGTLAIASKQGGECQNHWLVRMKYFGLEDTAYWMHMVHPHIKISQVTPTHVNCQSGCITTSFDSRGHPAICLATATACGIRQFEHCISSGPQHSQCNSKRLYTFRSWSVCSQHSSQHRSACIQGTCC